MVKNGTLSRVWTGMIVSYRGCCRRMLIFSVGNPPRERWAVTRGSIYLKFVLQAIFVLPFVITLLILPGIVFYTQAATFPLTFDPDDLERAGINAQVFLSLVAVFTVAFVELLQVARERTVDHKAQASILVAIEAGILVEYAARDVSNLAGSIKVSVASPDLRAPLYALIVGLMLSVAWDVGQAAVSVLYRLTAQAPLPDNATSLDDDETTPASSKSRHKDTADVFPVHTRAGSSSAAGGWVR